MDGANKYTESNPYMGKVVLRRYVEVEKSSELDCLWFKCGDSE